MSSLADGYFSKFTGRLLTAAVSAAVFLFSQTEALALPVTAVLDLPVGGERFLRVDADPVVLVEPEGLISFESLPSKEAFVVAKKSGRGRLFVMTPNANVFRVLTLRIRDDKGKAEKQSWTAEELAEVQKQCPKLDMQITSYGQEIEAVVHTSECRQALLKLLRDDSFLSKNAAFSFNTDVMRDQLVHIEKKLQGLPVKDRIQLFYMNAKLIIRGKMTLEERMVVLKAAWEETVGTFLFDDQTQRLPSEKSEKEAQIPAPKAQDPQNETPEIKVESIEQIKESNPELFEPGEIESGPVEKKEDIVPQNPHQKQKQQVKRQTTTRNKGSK